MPVTVTYGLVGLWEMPVRTVIQHGPKGKRVAAFAIDWPGWGRGAKTPEEAVELLEAYRDRYRRVARYAGLESEFVAAVLEGNSGRLPSHEAAISAAPLAALDFPCESSYGRMGIKRR
jgi:hypothetical protein